MKQRAIRRRASARGSVLRRSGWRRFADDHLPWNWSPGGIRKQGMGRWLGPRQRSANLDPGPLQPLAGFKCEFRAAMTDHAIDAADLQQRTATVIPNRRISADATSQLHHWRRTIHRDELSRIADLGPRHRGHPASAAEPDRAPRRKRGAAEGFASNRQLPSQPTPTRARWPGQCLAQAVAPEPPPCRP